MASKRRILKVKAANPAKRRKRPTTGGAAESASVPRLSVPATDATSPQLPAVPMASPEAPPLPPPVVVNSQGAVLRFLDAPSAELNTAYSDADLLNEARDWNYHLRDRRRWSTRSDSVNTLRSKAEDFVRELGVNEVILEQLVRARVVQVDLPAGQDEKATALRRLPWEYLLASVTRELRGEASPFTVVRRLRGGEARPDKLPQQRWLMVESAPGVLHDEYDFTSERNVIASSAAACGTKFKYIENPTLEALSQDIRTAPYYNVVHLSGFDIHQATQLYRSANAKATWTDVSSLTSPTLGRLEGFVLASKTGTPVPVDAQSLANLICPAAPVPPPSIVSSNIYNSAYEIAPSMVAAGAHSAIGFQDTFDDQLAEQFFAMFYRSWFAADWNPIAAFNFAWEQVRARRVRLQGSGLVLWTKHSLEGVQLITEQTLRAHTREKIEITAANAREFLEVRVEPLKELNYSILHNNGALFKEFSIKKSSLNVGEVSDLNVYVELNVGTDTYPFTGALALRYSDPGLDLKDVVRISLASALNRALRENVRTSLVVRVTWHDHMLYHKTHQVTLLSVDEWKDDDENRKWLPSFVLPRDPVVSQIIDRAQKYLMALQDDPTAGFDGYQSVDKPKGSPAEECIAIDQQVRAIWAALIYDTPLAYINPPPTFTDSSQRLRTPSDVLIGKRGTCIDLALLLASCLEYVEIYPAIILLKTHAFPAYWRHNTYHEDFGQAHAPNGVPLAGAQVHEAEILNRGQGFGWYFSTPDHFREILGEIQAGRLVPIETVSLTARASFGDALADGYKNLGNRRQFDSMLDIQLARSDGQRSVTPLPILRKDV